MYSPFIVSISKLFFFFFQDAKCRTKLCHGSCGDTPIVNAPNAINHTPTP